MKRLFRTVALAVMFSGGVYLGGLSASAATPIAPGGQWSPGFAELDSLVYKAHRRRYRHYHRRRHGRRYRRRSHRHRHYHNGWWYATPWFVPALRAPAPVYRGRRHVRWCLNRYRSYNPRTDRFMGYDGYRHRCRSPFRR